MESIIIKGGRPLKGTINISGSKNASLPILASSILVQKLELNNIPFLEDVKSMLFLLNSLGIDFKFTKKVKYKASVSLLKKVRKISKAPIVVIGGINNLNYKRLLNDGAKYIAISSFIWDNPKLKPELAIRKFK